MEVGSVETIPARWAAGWGAHCETNPGSGDIERARLKPVQRVGQQERAWYGIEAERGRTRKMHERTRGGKVAGNA